MKVFIACLGTETNTFSSMPTGVQTFQDTMLFRGDATDHPASTFSLPLHVWRTATEERQGQVVESLAAFAQPAGLTVRRVYEGFRDEILDDLRAAMPVDIVLLSMHGAMTAEGYQDCEGDLLACVREIVGPDAIVGGELDLHCSITPKMIENADALVVFKEYPHIDVGERAAELFDICLAALRGDAKPVMAVHDCRMVGMWRTPVEPVRGLVEDMQAAEGKEGILSVSFAHGFPWQDVPETSAKMLVIADGDAGLAAETRAGVRAKDLGPARRDPAGHRDHRRGAGPDRSGPRPGSRRGCRRQCRRRRALGLDLPAGPRARTRRNGSAVRLLLGPGCRAFSARKRARAPRSGSASAANAGRTPAGPWT